MSRTLVGSLAALLLAPPLGVSAAPRNLDLNALIAGQCGPPGYRTDSGCNVQLGPGTFHVAETVTLGACTSTSVRNSVTLQGTSAGMMAGLPGGLTKLRVPPRARRSSGPVLRDTPCSPLAARASSRFAI